MLKRIVLILTLFCLMTTCFMFKGVKSVESNACMCNGGTTFPTSFDGIVSGLDSWKIGDAGTCSYLSFKNIGTANNFETSTDNDLSAPNSFHARTTIGVLGNGWWNFTQNFTSISTINISFYDESTFGANTDAMYFVCYADDHAVINMGFDDGTFKWQDVSVGWKTLLNYNFDTRYYLVITSNGTNNFDIKIMDASFNILREIGYAGSYASTYSTFETIHIYSTTSVNGVGLYFDNFYITGEISGGSTAYGECFDFSSYQNVYNMPISGWKRTGLQTSYKYLELSGTSKLTGKLNGYKLLVYKEQIYDDEILTNYGMYIDGEYVGNPECTERYDERSYFLVWNLSSYNIRLENQTPIFEFYHDIDINVHSFAWYLEVLDLFEFVGPPAVSSIAFFYSTDKIDGTISTNPTIQLNCHPNWILYYSETSSSVNPEYENDIALLDSSQLPLSTHSTWNIPFTYAHKTIFFDVYVDTIEKYKLYVYDNNGALTGSTQYYPKDMLLYHGIYGFTPYTEGNYTVHLKNGATTVVSRKFNVTSLDEYFSLWTYPNPSKTQSTVTLGVYSSQPNLYNNYKIGIFTKISDVTSLDKADDTITIPYFINNYYYTETFIPLNYGTAFIRLFASNGTIYFPVTGVYQHFIQGETVFNRIWTSLLDNNNIGYINEEFLIYYTFNVPLVDAQIFWDDQPIKQVSFGSNKFSFSYHEIGTYSLSMKARANNTWTLVPGCQITISLIEKEQDGSTDVLPKIGDQLGYIVGLIITMFCMLAPLLIAHGLHANVSIPALAYALCGGVGVAVSTGLGFFPFWILAFIVIIGILIVVVKYVFNSGSGSE